MQYCAGNFMQVHDPANSRLALDQSNGFLYYGYIGGLKVVNSDNFKLKQMFNFSSVARFQSKFPSNSFHNIISSILIFYIRR